MRRVIPLLNSTSTLGWRSCSVLLWCSLLLRTSRGKKPLFGLLAVDCRYFFVQYRKVEYLIPWSTLNCFWLLPVAFHFSTRANIFSRLVLACISDVFGYKANRSKNYMQGGLLGRIRLAGPVWKWKGWSWHSVYRAIFLIMTTRYVLVFHQGGLSLTIFPGCSLRSGCAEYRNQTHQIHRRFFYTTKPFFLKGVGYIHLPFHTVDQIFF